MPSPAPDGPWNPGAYLTYSSERTQPFIDLLNRTRLPNPARIVDLGCGPGNGMPVLRRLWPGAQILGIDSSANMLQRAREATANDPNIHYQHSDIRHLDLAPRADLMVSNAALQWIPEHRQLLGQFQRNIAPGGVLAIQIPGNFDAPSHRLLAEFAAKEPYREHVDPAAMLQPTAKVSDYMHDVAATGWTVEGWETDYHHVLQGEDPVYDWIAAAAARPVLQGLPTDLRTRFTTEYKAALREAYPRTSLGTILRFRRRFFIARRSS